MAKTNMRNSNSLLRTALSLLALCLSIRFVPVCSFEIGIRNSPSRSIHIRCGKSGISIHTSDHSAWTLCNRRHSINSVSTSLSTTASSSADGTDDVSVGAAAPTTRDFDSPVLRQVYASMLQHVAEYGHPNIPLGASAGRQCETLRRLHTQQKLSASDVAQLDTLKFRWNSLEDVAKTADFQELFARLVQYSVDKDGDVSPPKKYPADPELGAWVTGLRRVGEDDMDVDRVRVLNEIGFQWESPRQCGSAFMFQYRDILERLKAASVSADSVSATDSILSESEVQQWIQAQREAVKRGTLSETRQHYMESVAGVDWLTTG